MKPVGVVRKYTISGIDRFSVELLERLEEGTELYTTPQTKPLSDDEIIQVHKETFSKVATALDFARAIEERHGIK